MTGLAGWLVEQRKNRDWTQKDVADRVGVDVRQVSRWETGENVPPRAKLKAIAETFGLEDVDGFISAVKREKEIPTPESRPSMVVPFYAQKFVREAAIEAGMTPAEWIGRLIARISSSPALVQTFIKDAVREGFDPSFGSTHPQDSKRPQGSHA